MEIGLHIVDEQWIIDCAKQGVLLDERNYRIRISHSDIVAHENTIAQAAATALATYHPDQDVFSEKNVFYQTSSNHYDDAEEDAETDSTISANTPPAFNNSKSRKISISNRQISPPKPNLMAASLPPQQAAAVRSTSNKQSDNTASTAHRQELPQPPPDPDTLIVYTHPAAAHIRKKIKKKRLDESDSWGDRSQPKIKFLKREVEVDPYATNIEPTVIFIYYFSNLPIRNLRKNPFFPSLHILICST